MLRRLTTTLRLELLIQARCFFPHTYLALAVLTVVAFLFALPEPYQAWLVPPLMLGEPALLGLMLVGGMRYLEKNEGSLSALVVTPLRDGEYLIGTVLASVLLACAAGVVIQAGVIGFDIRIALLIPPLFLVASIVGLLGLALSTYAAEFIHFLMTRAVPVTALLQAPLLAYFDVLPRWVFAWVPTDPALFAFALLASDAFDPALYTFYVAELAVFCALAFAWALYCFRTRVRERLEEA